MESNRRSVYLPEPRLALYFITFSPPIRFCTIHTHNQQFICQFWLDHIPYMPFAGGSSCNSKTECQTLNKWRKFCSVNHKGEVRLSRQNVVLAKKEDSGSASKNHIAPQPESNGFHKALDFKRLSTDNIYFLNHNVIISLISLLTFLYCESEISLGFL